jgi:phenylalanyl-tRNA synthetase beta chain
LQFFEFGKTYSVSGENKYAEKQHLSIYITGKRNADSWKSKGDKTDIYFAKAVAEKIIQLAGLKINAVNTVVSNKNLDSCLELKVKNDVVATIGNINKKTGERFDIDWDKLISLNKKVKIEFTGIPKFPAVQRDLSIVVNKAVKYEDVEKATAGARVNKLQSVNLFDIFESDKLGADKKSLAVSFTFLDEEKTLTDKEIDSMMSKIIVSYEKELNAEIRK